MRPLQSSDKSQPLGFYHYTEVWPKFHLSQVLLLIVFHKMDFMDNLPQVYTYHFMKTVMLTAFE